MKYLYKILLIALISLPFFSCKKEPITRKVGYELEFYESQNPTYSFSVLQTSTNMGGPIVPRLNTPKIIKEEYMLEVGTHIYFRTTHSTGNYTYEQRIYIDDELVSYKRMEGYYSNVVEEWGIDDNSQFHTKIDNEIDFILD
jgi:hypothetical protein